MASALRGAAERFAARHKGEALRLRFVGVDHRGPTSLYACLAPPIDYVQSLTNTILDEIQGSYGEKVAKRSNPPYHVTLINTLKSRHVQLGPTHFPSLKDTDLDLGTEVVNGRLAGRMVAA